MNPTPPAAHSLTLEREVIRVSVDVDESDPHEAGPIWVEMTRRGLSLGWDGLKAAEVKATWKELRHVWAWWQTEDELHGATLELHAVQATIDEARAELADLLARIRAAHAVARRAEISMVKGEPT